MKNMNNIMKIMNESKPLNTETFSASRTEDRLKEPPNNALSEHNFENIIINAFDHGTPGGTAIIENSSL